MEPRLRIWVNSNGLKATISILSTSVTKKNIEVLLGIRKIVFGICWDTIDDALHNIILTGEPQINITAAEAVIKPRHLFIGNKEIDIHSNDFNDLKKRFRLHNDIINSMQQTMTECDSLEGLFILKNEVFCTEEYAEQGTDIFGRIIHLPQLTAPALTCDQTITITRRDEYIDYCAKKNGYLILSKTDEFGIAEPYFVSQTKMEVFFIALPVMHCQDVLLNYLYCDIHETFFKMLDYDSFLQRNELSNVLSQNKAVRLLIRSGKKAQASVDAHIDFRFANKPDPIERTDGTIDIWEISPFQKIDKGEIIAIKTLPTMGKSGENVFGETINPAEPKDIEIKIGPNVLITKEDETITYSAGCCGVVKIFNNYIDIIDTLIINGDVGPQTGNLHSKSHIIISGSILAGFKVECDGNLTIGGGVEENTLVVCKKNIHISMGVFGEKTTIVVKGDAKIGFIQHSRVHVEGNLAVKKYIYHARVFCQGKISVNDIGLENQKTGCVIGGEIVAMTSIRLASAGSENTITKLNCGVNPEALKTMEILREKISSLNKHATKLRNAIGIDIESQSALEKLKLLPAHEKERVKKLLVDLKEISQEQASSMEKIPQLEKKALSSNLESCTIFIKKQVIPQIHVRIGIDTTLLSHRTYGVTLRYLIDKGICVSN